MIEKIVLEFMKQHNWASSVEIIEENVLSDSNGIPILPGTKYVLQMIPSEVESAPTLRIFCPKKIKNCYTE